MKVGPNKQSPIVQNRKLNILTICNVIATKDNLLRRGIPMVRARCPLCGVMWCGGRDDKTFIF